MGFFTFTTNTLILFTLLYHTLTYYKNKIKKTTNKNHPYVFIIMSLLLSFDQITNLNNFITWYWIKYLFIFLLCFPGSTLGHKLYKEYIERACLLFGDAMEEICADGILCLYNKSKVYITEVIDYVNALVRRRGDPKEAIEFKEIQGNSEDVKNE